MTPQFSVAVFPLLKTSRPVRIGKYHFRSTDDVADVSAAEAAAIREIADMLYLFDDLRLQSASYSLLPPLDLDPLNEQQLSELIDVQAAVAYLYASPHETYGDLFLSSEYASLALFTPGLISRFTLRPEHHVNDLGAALEFDGRNKVQGYVGVYNFRHHFWVTKGSRLYGTIPRPTPNLSQDLSAEIEYGSAVRDDYRLLLELLNRQPTAASSRMFTAVRWFNSANAEKSDDAAAVVNLSIAFETLLKLPSDSKTNRFTDTVALLLGRLPRLDVWAEQFYDARSRIAHEGQAEQLHFFVGDRKRASEGQLYHSLLTYGRQIFQLCLGALLAGLKMAERAGIEEKLVTNQERFTLLCRVLTDSSLDVSERLKRIVPTIAAIQRYRYVYESNLKLATIMGAVRAAAECVLAGEEAIRQNLKDHLERLVRTKRSADYFDELTSLQDMADNLTNEDVQTNYISDVVPPVVAVFRLIKAVWLDVFMHYFWLKEQREKSKTDGA
ncbi:MAG: hypothetical protein ACXW4P_08970 [Thermoanaerobaculia bacterium]